MHYIRIRLQIINMFFFNGVFKLLLIVGVESDFNDGGETIEVKEKYNTWNYLSNLNLSFSESSSGNAQ